MDLPWPKSSYILLSYGDHVNIAVYVFLSLWAGIPMVVALMGYGRILWRDNEASDVLLGPHFS